MIEVYHGDSATGGKVRMGLDTSHDAWHGAYSAFMRWRQKIAQVAGIPPLELMEGFWEKGSYRDPFTEMAKHFPASAAQYYDSLPIKWSALKPDPLHVLLHHSDCEGTIGPKACAKIADRLEALLPLLPTGDSGGHIGDYRDKTQAFIDGCRKAAAANESLIFH
jgi:hypothetical protein